MKVLNCCQSDWANFSYDNCQALKSVGVDCEAVTENPHRFGYENETVLTTNQIYEKIKKADLVQVMHSDLKMLNLCKLAGKKRVIVYHAGTYFRKQSKMLNEAFNPFVERSIIALGEFAGMGAKNETYLVGAVNTDKLRPGGKSIEPPYTLAHFPSEPTIKGTRVIERVVRNIYKTRGDFNFKLSERIIPFRENLKRISECDIYVELFAPFQDGFNYGSWGITALEAAALGKVVVTCHITEDVYHKTYGRTTPFFVSNTEGHLHSKIDELLSFPPDKITKLQSETRRWVVENHSYKATGERLKKILDGL